MNANGGICRLGGLHCTGSAGEDLCEAGAGFARLPAQFMMNCSSELCHGIAVADRREVSRITFVCGSAASPDSL
jgi:hypothetical protein